MGLWTLAVFIVAASQAAATLPAAPAATSAPDDALVALVSVERIRQGLQRPGLKIPVVDPIPVFRSEVEERLLENPLQGMRRELAENSGYRGRSGIDVLPLAMELVKSIKRAYRAYSEARIRKEVQEALDAFCAEHDCSVVSDGPPPMEGIVLPRRNTN